MATVNVTVFDQEQYDGDWPPENMKAAMVWFQAKLDLVPEEYQDTATLDIDSAGGYEGTHYGHINVAYSRPETTEETERREASWRLRQHALEARERFALAELKAKYEGR